MMDMNNNDSELYCIVEALIDYLRECDDGTTISTAELLNRTGNPVTEFDQNELFSIHNALFKAAAENHIKLDMSAHDGMLEGLPFGLDFKVCNSEGQIRCPYCGSQNTARYVYGFPAFDDDMQRKIDSGKVVLGGCEMDPGGHMPKRRCNDCDRDF